MGTSAARRATNTANPQPHVKIDESGTVEPSFRSPNIFKPFTAAVASVGTPVVVWTPASGMRFRLMGYTYSSGGTGGAVFKEASVAVGIGSLFVGAPAAANVVVNSPPLVNGIFAASRNNQLVVDSTVAGITYTGTVYGTEEAGN